MTDLFSAIHPHFAAACGHSFLGIPPWWHYIKPAPQPPTCTVDLNFPSDIWLIVLAVIDILLRIAGFVAVVSIIIAGFSYVLSLGSSDKVTAARKRIQNSLIGLAIALIATALVEFIGKYFG